MDTCGETSVEDARVDHVDGRARDVGEDLIEDLRELELVLAGS
jgi:hypothetical protein